MIRLSKSHDPRLPTDSFLISVMGCGQGCGKSFIASNLSLAFRQRGLQVAHIQVNGHVPKLKPHSNSHMIFFDTDDLPSVAAHTLFNQSHIVLLVIEPGRALHKRMVERLADVKNPHTVKVIVNKTTDLIETSNAYRQVRNQFAMTAPHLKVSCLGNIPDISGSKTEALFLRFINACALKLMNGYRRWERRYY